MPKNIDEQLEELQNEIGMIDLQINRLLAEKSLLQAQMEELLNGIQNHTSN